MHWRTERVSVEKDFDDLWVGVKGQSNREIARTPRNVLRYSVGVEVVGGRATNRTRGCQSLPNPDELRMPTAIHGSEAWGAKVPGREGKNPDHLLRSLNLD